MDSATQILNLIYTLAAKFDAGDFEGAARMLSEGVFEMGQGQQVSASEMLALWKDILILYNGSPRTRHVVTNTALEIGEKSGFATCRSVYSVWQQPPDKPLSLIVSGRYDDEFICEGGVWRFAKRAYQQMDLVGDLSNHLNADAIAQFKP